jgi:hypothetical protein
LLEGALAGVVAAIGLWKLALEDEERAKFAGYFLRRLTRRSAT